jgi:prepilin-type N-terminal cleavage/methylation domain-containing protein
MRTARENLRLRQRGFTLVELLIVVAVIMVLIGILLPAMGKVHERAAVTRTTTEMTAIQSGLQAYFTDFNMYPPSGPAYGNLAAGRGSVMLAQGLMGYLGYDVDGAGPLLASGAASPNPSDPVYGFRTRKMGKGMSAMGVTAQVYGPYMTPDPKTLKGTGGRSQYFVDAWSEEAKSGGSYNHEILYFRSTRAPGADPAKLAALADPTASPGKLFGTGAISNQQSDYFFDTADCVSEPDIPIPFTSPTPGFMAKIGADVSFTNVMGARSYLLISSGPDGKYFTNDDIIVSK